LVDSPNVVTVLHMTARPIIIVDLLYGLAMV
jgi:hypothetical protein